MLDIFSEGHLYLKKQEIWIAESNTRTALPGGQIVDKVRGSRLGFFFKRAIESLALAYYPECREFFINKVL